VEVRITQISGGADDLAALYRRLLGEPELRGRLSARSRPPAPGSTDGFTLESLLVTAPGDDDLEPVLRVVADWFTAPARPRPEPPVPARTVICLSRPGGVSFELSAATFDGLTPGEQRSQLDHVAKLLGQP
jgi:Effector Associated Constant Component 1